jgi:hypothetical protein
VKASAGGGGGASSLIVDHGTLSEVAQGLSGAGDALDGCGNGMPAGGDHGLAGPLLAQMLARVSEVGARISFEAKTLAAVVTECNSAVADADTAVAESYLVEGQGRG